MVLQADISPAWMYLVGDVELVLGAIRAFIAFGPTIQIHSSHNFAVKLDGNVVSIARQHKVIPFTRRFHRILRWRHQIINCACVMKAIRLCVVHGNFNPVRPDVFARARFQRERADEDAAVALRTDFKIAGELKVTPDVLMQQDVIAGMGIQTSVLNMSARQWLTGTCHPAVRGVPVEQQQPPCGSLSSGQ